MARITAALLLLLTFSPDDTPVSSPTDLTDFLAPGGAVIDTNDDGLPDTLNLRIVIPTPEKATPWHVAAAAEIAARVGYETAGLSFPVVTTAADPTWTGMVARVGLADELMPRLKAGAPAVIPYLRPGVGAVVMIRGDADLPELLVVGGDGTGLHRAAAMYAGRWPNAWEIWGAKRSTRLSKIVEESRVVLARAGIDAAETHLRALVYGIDPEQDKSPDRLDEEKQRNLDKMVFNIGEVRAAIVDISAPAPDRERISFAFAAVRDGHERGADSLLLNYPGVAEIRVTVNGAAEGAVVVPRFGLPARMLQRRPDPAAQQEQKKVAGPDHDLSNLYTGEALFSDQLQDKVADRVEATLVAGAALVTAELGNFAARLGLECSGIDLPLVAVDPRPDQLEKIRSPILVGEGQGTGALRRRGVLDPPELAPGTGYIGLIPKAFNDSHAVVVLGDAAGIDRALAYLARTYPGITRATPGELTAADVRKRAERLLAGGSVAGQVLCAIRAIDNEVPTLARRDLAEVGVVITLDKAADATAAPISAVLEGKLPGVAVKAEVVGRRDPRKIFADTQVFVSEVAHFRALFSEKFLPTVKPGTTVDIDLRLSEPHAVLTELRNEILEQLTRAGVDLEHSRVRVLCAYKQGFHWLRDEVLPQLAGVGIHRIEIRVRPETTDLTAIRKFYRDRNSRLLELYPIDELLARELSIPLERIVLRLDASLQAAYAVAVRNAAGEAIYEAAFDPRTAPRTYLELYPEWARLEAPTGWFTAGSAGTTIVDERIPTDPERIWDYYQGTVLKQVHEHVLAVTEKKPLQSKQPFFHTIQVEARLSEPDERLDLDEELLSSIEALHEDIYFGTLDLLNGMVPREAEKLPEDARYLTRIGAPGSVIPLISNGPAGSAPEAIFTLLGHRATKNSVAITWKTAEGKTGNRNIDISPLKVEKTRLSGITIDAQGPRRWLIEATVPSPDDIAGIAAAVPVLQKCDDLALAGSLFANPVGGEIEFTLTAPGARRIACLALGRTAPEMPATPITAGERLVTPERIISPAEAIDITRRLGTLPGVTVWRSGESFQERPVYSLEITAPTRSTHLSRARMITARPSILITGRQHANEVSSTTHILMLAEKLATDPAFLEYRKRVNVILHPVENPDGAELMEQLRALNPNHMNHAARYTALGTDLGTQLNNPDSLLTEALVRPMLWERWLPDIYLNCHGYPSHEWVQQFSGYQPYQFLDYWIPRGWYTYITHLDDPRQPEYRPATAAVIEAIDRGLMSDPEQKALNHRLYERYWRWAGRWQPHAVNLELHGETLMYADRTSDVPRKPSARTQTTIIEETVEAMDETPGPEWMKTVVTQGLYYLESHLRVLASSTSLIEEVEEESGGRVHRARYRKRPFVPAPR